MLAELDSHELSEWMAFEQVYGPLGPERVDLLFAMLMATVANAAPRRKGKSPATPKQFLPRWDQNRPQQTPEEQLALVYQLNAAFGGTVKPAA